MDGFVMILCKFKTVLYYQCQITTAAGATVTRDVPEDAMLIARPEQIVKPGLARRFRREPQKK